MKTSSDRWTFFEIPIRSQNFFGPAVPHYNLQESQAVSKRM